MQTNKVLIRYVGYVVYPMVFILSATEMVRSTVDTEFAFAVEAELLALILLALVAFNACTIPQVHHIQLLLKDLVSPQTSRILCR